MLEDLEFTIGDAKALAGRAIVYTLNRAGSSNPFNPRYPALAVASDPTELADILSSLLPFPEELKDMLHQGIKNSADIWKRTMFGQTMYQTVHDMMANGLDALELPKELKEQMASEMESIPEEETGVPHQGFFVPLVGFDPDVLDPYGEEVDLALAPEVPNISYAGLVLTGHAQHYLASYLLQQDDAAAAINSNTASTTPNLRDLPKDEFVRILEKKVSAIMYALESGKDFEGDERDLIQLTSGTIFIRDTLNLLRVAKSDLPAKVKVIELYIRRMTLLIEERYEEIPILDKELAGLDGE